MCGHRVDGEAGPSRAVASAAVLPTGKKPAATAALPVEAPAENDGIRSPLQPANANAYPAETDLWDGSYSPKAMIGTWIACGVGCLVLIVAAAMVDRRDVWIAAVCAIVALNLYLALLLAYRRFNVHYHLTSQRFVHQSGIIRRVTDRVEVIDFDDITFVQGIVDRMVNVGTISIVSGDPTDPRLVLQGIENVAHVAHLMDDARRAERRRRGLHIDQR